jgi:hypothetical protein
VGCLKDCADHLHDMAGLEPKMFGIRHKKKSLDHARSLDALHGAVTGFHQKDEEPEPQAEKPPGAPAAVFEHPGKGDGDDEEEAIKALLPELRRERTALAREHQEWLRKTGKELSSS